MPNQPLNQLLERLASLRKGNDEIYSLYAFHGEAIAKKLNDDMCKKAVNDMEIKMQEWVERILTAQRPSPIYFLNAIIPIPEIHPSLGNSKNLLHVKRRTLFGSVSDRLFGNASKLEGRLSPELEGTIHPELSGDITGLSGKITNVGGNVTGVVALIHNSPQREKPRHIFNILLHERFGGDKDDFMNELVWIWRRRIYLELRKSNLFVPSKTSHQDRFRNTVYNCRKALEGELSKYGPFPMDFFIDTLSQIEKGVMNKLDSLDNGVKDRIVIGGRRCGKTEWLKQYLIEVGSGRMKTAISEAGLVGQLPTAISMFRGMNFSRGNPTEKGGFINPDKTFRLNNSLDTIRLIDEELLARETHTRLNPSFRGISNKELRRRAEKLKEERINLANEALRFAMKNKQTNTSFSGMCGEAEPKAHSSVTKTSRNAIEENFKMLTNAEIANVGLKTSEVIGKHYGDRRDIHIQDIVFTDKESVAGAYIMPIGIFIGLLKTPRGWQVICSGEKTKGGEKDTLKAIVYSLAIGENRYFAFMFSSGKIETVQMAKEKTSVDRYIEKMEKTPRKTDLSLLSEKHKLWLRMPLLPHPSLTPAAQHVFIHKYLKPMESEKSSFPPKDYGNDVEKDFNTWLKHTGFSFNPKDLEKHIEASKKAIGYGCQFYKNIKVSPNGKNIGVFGGVGISNCRVEILRYDQYLSIWRVSNIYALSPHQGVLIESVFVGDKNILVGISTDSQNAEAWYVGNRIEFGPILKKPVDENGGWVEKLFNFLEHN